MTAGGDRSPTCFGAPRLRLGPGAASNLEVAFLGVPYDGATPMHDPELLARRGPATIRDASLAAYALRVDPRSGLPSGAWDLDGGRPVLRAVRMGDFGDLPVAPEDSPDDVARCVGEAVASLSGECAFPVVLGGDHSVAFGVAAGLSGSGPIGILSLDAHLDLGAGLSGMAPLTHATWVSHAARLPHVAQVVVAGPRLFHPLASSVERALGGDRPAPDLAEHLASRGIDHMVPAAALVTSAGIEALIDGLDPGLGWQLSLDIDVLEPIFAPETGMPVAMGLTPRELAHLLARLAGRIELVSFDLCEVAAGDGRANPTARTAAALIAGVLGALYR